MRILGLCNPASGAQPERLDALKRFASAVTGASVQMSVAATQSAADAELALADAALEATDILLISGGDGTIQHALSWCLHGKRSAPESIPLIALLPAGSTNMTAMDINSSRGWQPCLDRFLGHIDTSEILPTSSRELIDVRDGNRVHAGFFVGSGAIVRGIEYCNNVLWAGGAARQERTAGLAMVRTIWGVLRKTPPFDQIEALSILANADQPSAIKHHPEAGALLFAASTLDRLLVGVRPFWGRQDEPMPYVLVDRDAKLLTKLPGLLGVPGFSRPVADAGFHSHNCTNLVLHADSAYAIDGELFSPQENSLELSVSRSLRFIEL